MMDYVIKHQHKIQSIVGFFWVFLFFFCGAVVGVVGVVISHVKSFESISQQWQRASVAKTGSESFNVTSPQR